MTTFLHREMIDRMPGKAALSTLLIVHSTPGLTIRRVACRLGVRREAARRQIAELRRLGLVEVIGADERDIPPTGRQPHGLAATQSGDRVLSYVRRISEVLRRVEEVPHVA